MQILPISYSNNVQHSYMKEHTVKSCDTFHPSFKSYEKILDTVIQIRYKNNEGVEDAFSALFNNIVLDSNVVKDKNFALIENIYRKTGLKGLLSELIYTHSKLDPIIRMVNDNLYPLATKEGKPILEIFSFDKYHTQIIFGHDKNIMEFGLNRKGGFEICQSRPSYTIQTGFYPTGNRKYITIQHTNSNPETTYYRKDGSKNALKNFFLGGTIPPIY